MAKSTLQASPVRIRVAALSTSNLTLSGAQTVDSVVLVAGDLVGCVGQSDNKNGVYIVQSGAWLVADPGFGTGLEIYARAGGSNAGKVYGCDTTGAIDWGTTSTTFTLKGSSGAAFDAASPGTIGGTTPGTLNGTRVYLTANVGAPTSGKVELIRNAATNGIVINAGNGASLAIVGSTSATAQLQKTITALSLADGATGDIALTAGGGHGMVTAVAASGSNSGVFSFAANGTTTTNGLTYTNFATTDTPAKLCAYANSGSLRIKNNLGSTQTILVELTHVATA